MNKRLELLTARTSLLVDIEYLNPLEELAMDEAEEDKDEVEEDEVEEDKDDFGDTFPLFHLFWTILDLGGKA